MKWELINEEDGCVLWPLHPFPRMTSRGFPEEAGVAIRTFFDISGGHMRYFIAEDDLNAVEKIHSKLTDEKFARQLAQKIHSACLKTNAFCLRTMLLEPGKMTDAQLYEKFTEHYALYVKMNTPGLLYPFVELAGGLITRDLEEMVSRKIKERGINGSVGEFAAVLSTPLEETGAMRQERDLLRIAAKKGNGGNVEEDVRNHVKRFAWVYYGYVGPALTENQIKKRASEIEDPEFQLDAIDKRMCELKEKQKKYASELRLDGKQSGLVKLARDAVFLKALRKESMFHSFYAMEPFLKEVAKRSGYALKSVMSATSEEMPLILEKKLPESRLRERRGRVIMYADGKAERIMTGKEAEEFAKQSEQETVTDVKELKGSCACPGNASGTVRIVNTPEEMKKMVKGDILVSLATTPEIVPAMKIASAIVTNIGGLTSHAAIVSRELGVPCVIGTKIATRVFRDGDRVEVDASSGIVRKIS